MSIGIIIAPADAPQTPAPPQPWPAPGPRLNDHEQRLVAAVEHRKGRATVWEAVNAVVRELAPRSRRELRHVRVTLLCSMDRLLRLGRLQREDRDFVKIVGITKPPVAPTPSPQPAQQSYAHVFEC